MEQVRTGTTLRVLLPNTFDSIQLLLAVRRAPLTALLTRQGIRSPAISGNDESTAEPFAREAKFITEHLLLHRDVTVTIEGIDKYSNYFGTVLDAQGRNVSVNLLRMGLASVVDWSASPKTDLAAFKEAERLAQEERLRIWKDHKGSLKASGKKTDKGGSSEIFTAKVHRTRVAYTHSPWQVVEVVNGSTISVRVNKGDRGDVDRKVSFSSVTVPRLLTRYDEIDPDKEAALSDEKRAKLEVRRASTPPSEPTRLGGSPPLTDRVAGQGEAAQAAHWQDCPLRV